MGFHAQLRTTMRDHLAKAQDAGIEYKSLEAAYEERYPNEYDRKVAMDRDPRVARAVSNWNHHRNAANMYANVLTAELLADS